MALSRLIPGRLREGAGLLRTRDFRNVFLAQSVSVFGDGITPVALTFAVLDLTGSGTDLGIVLAAQSLPLVALALVGGVWADRLPRAALMMTSDLVRAAVQITAAVLLLTGTAQIWQLAVLAAMHGAAEAFFRPAAGALLPQIVPASGLQQANALMGMSDNFGWMVGPAIAGTLVALIGAGGAIAVDGATFLVSAAFLAALRVPAVVRHEAVLGFFAELRAGWREVKSRTWLWTMLLRVCLVLFVVIAPFQVLGPLGLRQQGYGAAVWGWLQAVFSAGMIVGALVALRYRPKRPMIVVTLTGSTAVAAPLAMAISGDPWTLAAVYGLRGIAVGVLVTIWNTTLQTQIPKESLGRVVAWDWMASMALWPAGLALAGPLAQIYGVTAICWVSGILGLVVAFWVLLVKDVWRLRPAAVLAGGAGLSPPDGGPALSAPPAAVPPKD
jgi:MFS family permease